VITILKPLEGIGDFRIGSNVRSVLQEYKYELSEDEYNTGQDTYIFRTLGISLFVNKESGLIESVLSDEECLFKGMNIIGMSLNSFIIHVESEYVGIPDCLDFQEDGIPQYVYEFEDLGLQVWTKNDIVVTVIATKYDEEE